MIELYKRVSAILDKLDFNDLWKGFYKYDFAFYNDNFIIINDNTFPYDRRFVGNTAIEYEGKYIAIWNVHDPGSMDCEELASGIVHEMFHAFQRENKETRYPNDLAMLDYPDNIENYQIKYNENTALAKIHLTDDAVVQKDLFAQFISMRKKRANLIGDIIRCELLTETSEGIAEYVGSKALKQISPDKYNARVLKYCDALQSLDTTFFDIRRMSYYSGTLFCLAAEKTDIRVWHEIENNTLTFFEWIASDYSEIEFSCFFDERLPELAELNIREKDKSIKDFIENHHVYISGDFTVCGYDPMNMIKTDDKVLCRHFVILHDNKKEEVRQIFQPVLLEMMPNTANKVSAYIL